MGVAPADREARITGAVLGLLAGDKIGGPTAMALELIESLLANRTFDPSDVLSRYRSWYRTAGFDTGIVSDLVLRAEAKEPIDEIVTRVDRELDGKTAGCNPMHRSLALALVPYWEGPGLLDTLGTLARREARLTHHHRMAGDCAAAYVCALATIVRNGWEESAVSLAAPLNVLGLSVENGDLDLPRHQLHPRGYSPDVLQAAVWFVSQAHSFDEALSESLNFAGPENYCPVLVGPLAGARWGIDLSAGNALATCPAKTRERMTRALAKIRLFWRER